MKKYFTEEQVMEFVRKYLILLGYSTDLEIKRYVLDDEKVGFDLYYEAELKGSKKRLVAPLTRKNFVFLLKNALETLGYGEFFVAIFVVEERVVYCVSPIMNQKEFYVKSKGKDRKRR